MENNKRRIAALALFRNLYNEERSDVMTILCEFAKNIVYGKHLSGFTPTQIKDELKLEYDFYIPEYVVESVIKKFCKKDNSKYYPKESISPQKVNEQEIEKIEKSHEIILSKLISFIEEKTSKKLSGHEKENLFQSFCRYMIDESDVEYSEYISSFIIDVQNDVELTKLIQTIKEGIVLYTGIQYNDSVSETGSWKDDFTIYVEQEILFHLAGYNGTLYKQLYNDFGELIKEINRKAHKQLIKIKYFDSVKIEIEKFFNKAERIVNGKETLDCSNIAMVNIVQDCEHKSDVIAKKVSFFELLNNNQIEEEKEDKLFIDENSSYNIFYKENLEELANDFPTRDVEWSLRLLNYISLTRHGKMSGFEKSKCILLTGNSTTMSVAFHSLIKKNGEVPLATTLDYVTNKLWFKLNKGFGGSAYPKSFNIVTKAQIVLSAQIAGSVAQEFEKIKKEIAEKNKPESAIVAELAELKEKVRKPEDIQKSEIDDILDTISIADTERYLREREMERMAAEQQRKENERLQLEVAKTQKEKAAAQAIIEQKDKELQESKRQTLNQINNQIKDQEDKKHKADGDVDRRIRKIRWIPWTTIVVFICVVGVCTYIYGWDNMEFLTWLITAIITSVPYLVFAIGAKSLNPQNVIDVRYKNKYRTQMYEQYSVDLKKLKSLKEEKRRIEKELGVHTTK